MTLLEAAGWALLHAYHEDRANAAMHCAPVRFSPITFRLAEAVESASPGNTIAREVVSHKGQYEEDQGR